MKQKKLDLLSAIEHKEQCVVMLALFIDNSDDSSITSALGEEVFRYKTIKNTN